MSKLYGLIGQKLSYSYSKIIHSYIFEKLGIDAEYHLFEIEPENLKGDVSDLIKLGAKGVNVTIPYKCEVMKYLDKLSPEAEKIGAVNTIKLENSIKTGYNTDYYGFKMLLEKYEIDIFQKKIVILGSGGVVDPVLQYFSDNNCKKVTIVARDVLKAQLKYRAKNVIIVDYSNIPQGDIIINCTPCGMYPEISLSPVNAGVLKNFHTAIDLIYNPKTTLFLKNASEYGAKTVNGLYMLVGQAVKAEEIWNDFEIDKNIIDKVFEYIANDLSF